MKDTGSDRVRTDKENYLCGEGGEAHDLAVYNLI